MDHSTVVLILALNLIAIGALLAMIGRRMDEAQGMRGFATGSMVFGLAYLLRLALGHSATNLAAVLPDTASPSTPGNIRSSTMASQPPAATTGTFDGIALGMQMQGQDFGEMDVVLQQQYANDPLVHGESSRN